MDTTDRLRIANMFAALATSRKYTKAITPMASANVSEIQDDPRSLDEVADRTQHNPVENVPACAADQ